MVTEEKVQTKHPLGKNNFPVPRQDYEMFKTAILAALHTEDLTHTELVDALYGSLCAKFTGNVSWHTMTVKLDLEAQGLIERTSSKPQKYRLVE